MKTNRAVAADRRSAKQAAARKSDREKYRYLLDEVSRLEKEKDAIKKLSSAVENYSIVPKERTRTSEATAIVLASDWHIEERVRKEEVSGLNSFSLAIAERRVTQFFQGALRLWQITKKDVSIKNIVLALMGDFISGNIHDELLATCQVGPMTAILKAQEWIVGGIKFLLKNTDCELVLPCCNGNHSRVTKKLMHATEPENSLETLMYYSLAETFKANKRVKFIISGGYHTYLTVYDQVIRFHHGQNIKYQGGIGGMSVPLLRAIAQWNNGRRADLEALGHWHQARDYGRAIVNGSLIGYNAFALSIKAEFERPKQQFFLLDKRRGKTIVCPIILEA